MAFRNAALFTEAQIADAIALHRSTQPASSGDGAADGEAALADKAETFREKKVLWPSRKNSYRRVAAQAPTEQAETP